MLKKMVLAAVFAASGLAANATAVQLGDTVGFDLVNNNIANFHQDFVVTDAFDMSVGQHQVDVNVSLTDTFLLTVTPSNYCGILACNGTVTSFRFSDIAFEGGERLVDFIVTEAQNTFLGFTILSDYSISFNFNDDAFGNTTGIFLRGNFVTAPAAVPLPAAGGLLLAGLGGLAALRRRKRAA